MKESNTVRIVKLLEFGPKSAGEIASALNIQSKEVYPRVKRLIKWGFVKAEGIGNLRIYRLTDKYYQFKEYVRRYNLSDVISKLESELGRKLTNDEIYALVWLRVRLWRQ
ncbi:Transcriptional regulator, wHTH [Saccharolobus shibatae B12]|uniref:Transcriptional regulator, wHTH n=1 Tax=Saccharolobus shibatae (strain ATCC 51178 / DSM 5389 / JCM 8931 / NBRC 15437 / B12) TaxID=523848 RepID=A0A8F5BKL1_SACSH|nr:winged helix-turn-helix domain-containing protein [Saccharolobus shibatae]QXJ27109.1 Transcriptional regulator, wHTH [Saccharolobus shibatae B12]QXJ30002.1 Transcriptional regulator, wHTH [Saccharolobus shibatae B12]